MSLLKSLQTFLAPGNIFAPTRNFPYAQGLISQTANWNLEIDPLQNSVVAACVNAIARALPDAPLLLENRTQSGWTAVKDHECLRVLRAPNEDHSDADVWGLTAGYKATRGQAFWLLLTDQAGRVGELHVWNPERVTVLGDESHFISAYRLRTEAGGLLQIPKNQIIHFRHLPDFRNPRLGWSPLRTGRAQIAGDNIGATYHTSLLHNAGVVSLLVSLKEGAATGQVTPEQFQQVLTNIRRASRERAGCVEGINLPLEVHKLAYSPDEMNVDKLIQYYETRICAVMGVPQRVAGLGADPTYHNLSEALNDFWERRIVPDRNSDAATLNRQWLPLFGLDDGNWRFRFDFSSVPALQENRDALHARVREDFEKGLVDKKQARSLLGYSAAGDEAYAGVFFGEKAGTQTETPEGALSTSQIAAVKGLIQAEWDESKHPRDEDGRFTDGGGGHLARSSRAVGNSHEVPHLVDSYFDEQRKSSKKDGDKNQHLQKLHDIIGMIRGHLLPKRKNPQGVPPERLKAAGSGLERHLLGLINNAYIRGDDKKMIFSTYAGTLTYVSDRIPQHLHDTIIEKVKAIDLFENINDLNAVGLSKYGLKWGDKVVGCVMGDKHIMLDEAATSEKERRNTYLHELCHIIDFYGWRGRKDQEHQEISRQEDWTRAFHADMATRGKDTFFSKDARKDPTETFAEMMTFLLDPASVNVPNFKPSSNRSPQQQARDYCQANYGFMYGTLKSYGVI